MTKTDNGGRPAFPQSDLSAYGMGPNPEHSSSGLTAREHAAIALRVPDSGQQWLDDMIREARRMDAAEAAIQGMASVPVDLGRFASQQEFDERVDAAIEGNAKCARQYADALLSALRKEG